MRRFLAALAVGLLSSAATFACPGDITGDGKIGHADLAALLAAYNTTPGDPHWNPDADFNKDGIVGHSDLALLLSVYGTDCPKPDTMVLIPAGEFLMGDHHDDYWNSMPVHVVYIDSFYMDVYETTNARYAAALNWAMTQGMIVVIDGIVRDAATNTSYCDTTSSNLGSRIIYSGGVFSVTPTKENHPMVRVTWYGAAAYSNWRSQMEGRQPSYNLTTWACNFAADGYRLPTEAEREKAARGGEHNPYYRYPWGDTLDGSKANYWNSGDPYETGPYPWTTPVGYYDGNQVPPGVDMANGYGLYDIAGNVHEWCNDWYSSTYYQSSPYDNPKGPGSGAERVLRGGSWHSDFDGLLSCAFRAGTYPDFRYFSHGFRLSLD